LAEAMVGIYTKGRSMQESGLKS